MGMSWIPESFASNAVSLLSTQSVISSIGAARSWQFAGLWEDVVQGKLEIQRSVFTRESASFLLSPVEHPVLSVDHARNRRVFERFLLDTDQKVLAAEFRLAASSIASILRQYLAFIGLDCLASRVPPLLVMLAHAAAHPDKDLSRWNIELQAWGNALEVRARRPELQLRNALTPAEQAVLGELMQGASYGQIARCRGSSTRTVANQVASIYRQVRVSGRAELIRRLVDLLSDGDPAEPLGMQAEAPMYFQRRSA
jgi:DNA-binding CsgD family transcriptional regulator